MTRSSLALSSLLPFLCFLSLFVCPVLSGPSKNAMRLEEVSTLVFTRGEMTTARRSSPVPQMVCKGRHCEYAPSSALCRNVGFDGRDVTWKCEAEMPKGVRFGKVEVSCEGYNSRDDDYVLKGSCGLEYTLEGSPVYQEEEEAAHNREKQQEEDRHSSSWWNRWWSGEEHSSSSTQHKKHSTPPVPHHKPGQSFLDSLVDLCASIASIMFKFFALCIVMYFLYRIMCPPVLVSSPPVRPYRPGLFRSLLGFIPFGGSLYDAFNSPPPPSYAQATAPPSNPYNKYEQTRQQTYQPSYTNTQTQQQAGTEGYSFLHGALGGSVLGYLLGRRRAAQTAPAATYTEPQSSGGLFSFLNPFSSSTPTRPSTRAAPTPTQTVHHVHHHSPPPAHNPEYSSPAGARYPTASSGSGGGSSTSHTSTAYATTKRR